LCADILSINKWMLQRETHFKPQSRAWLSNCRFSRNSSSTSKVLWKAPATNLIQITQKV